WVSSAFFPMGNSACGRTSRPQPLRWNCRDEEYGRARDRGAPMPSNFDVEAAARHAEPSALQRVGPPRGPGDAAEREEVEAGNAGEQRRIALGDPADEIVGRVVADEAEEAVGARRERADRIRDAAADREAHQRRDVREPGEADAHRNP